jgi:subtilisin family serine protease
MRKDKVKAQPPQKAGQKQVQSSPKPFGPGPAVRPPKTPPKDAKMTQTDPGKKPFTPEVLDRTVIAIPLLEKFQKEIEELNKNPNRAPEPYHVIIDVNLEYHLGRTVARDCVKEMINDLIAKYNIDPQTQGINEAKSGLSQQYIFGILSGGLIQELVDLDSLDAKCHKTLAKESASGSQPVGTPAQAGSASRRAIYRIWPDFRVKALILKSISTVKADAARNSFAALGDDVVWAVMDSGIDKNHPHFKKHKNLLVDPPIDHRDFTVLSGQGEPLVDQFGHGTHVAGIIAGEMTRDDGSIVTESRFRDETGEVVTVTRNPDAISGMAPRCKLVSMKVLDKDGQGQASNLIAAIEAIQEINGDGRRVRIHGVNMSVGYDFEPEWFACGQSPLCVEVNRLVKSGVVVVVAAGNTGYGFVQDAQKGAVTAGLGLTINDPGNAELAITVGSTHRDMPHIYGVSYFSSKGPTGDGRIKPDLVAPGEKIISCAAGPPASGEAPAGSVAVGNDAGAASAENASSPAPATTGATGVVAGAAAAGTASAPAASTGTTAVAEAEAPKPVGKDKPTGKYKEDSGTSMAAPHVSGTIAAFLSVRREFIGQPEEVKQIFMSTATDLKRDQYFQGRGLVDLMRAIQSV